MSESSFSFFGITKVGEGSEKREEDIPIDVKYSLLLGWLIDRKILPMDWNSRLRTILKNASDLAVVTGDVGQQDEIDLLFAKQQLDHLLADETIDKSKTLFGVYNEARLAGWAQVISAFERDNIWMAQAAQILVQLIKYELPSMAAAAKSQRAQLSGLARSREEALQSSVAQEKMYNEKCKDMGVDGTLENLVDALLDLVSELPGLYSTIMDCVRDPDVFSALEFYRNFVAYTSSIIGDDKKNSFCPTLADVILSGVDILEDFPGNNVEVHDSQPQQQQQEVIELEWSPKMEGDPVDEVDWDADIQVIEEIEVMDHTEEFDPNQRSRHTLLDDVLELWSFLTMRVAQKDGNSNQTVADVVGAPSCPRAVRNAKPEVLLKAVEKLRDALEAPRLNHLLQIKASRQYRERVALELRKPLLVSKKLKQTVKFLDSKQKEITAVLEASRPKSLSLKSRARALRDQLEEALKQIYNGRQVILTGAIQQL